MEEKIQEYVRKDDSPHFFTLQFPELKNEEYLQAKQIAIEHNVICGSYSFFTFSTREDRDAYEAEFKEFRKEWEEEKKRRQMEADSRAYFEEEAQVLDLERLMYEAIGEQGVKYRPEDYSLEHRERVRAFIGQKITPFEDNHDLFKGYEIDKQKIKQEWQDFQANLEVKKMEEKNYVPKNEIEAEILKANPKHDPDFDFSDDNYYENYILAHKDDFEFMEQVLKVQGANCIESAASEVSYLLADFKAKMEGMLMPDATPEVLEEKVFTSAELSPEEKAELAKIEGAERVADFKQEYDSKSVDELLQIVGNAKGQHCPYFVNEDDNFENYFSGLSAIVLTSETAKYANRREFFIMGEVGEFKSLNTDESDVKWFGTQNAKFDANLREDFKFAKMVDEVFTQVENAWTDGKDKIEFCKIVEVAESNALKLCHEKDAEYDKRLDAIKNIDVNVKPKTNAEKLQRFCKKTLQNICADQTLQSYDKDDFKFLGFGSMKEGVEQFLLTTPSVKLEQMTRLIDAVAPDAVYNSQVNTYSDKVKKAVREDSVFRDRLKIARAKSSGISR